MSRLNLTSWQRQRLRRQMTQTLDARLYKRTLAVLEFDRGRPAAELARMLGVTRQSVHNWVQAYTSAHDPHDLLDEPGRGRHRLLDEDAEHLLAVLLDLCPQQLGYPHASWTIPLLQDVLEVCGPRPSDDTVRRVLHRLDYVWKRPRHDLEPDPLREKKTPYPAANPGLAAAQRGVGRGRDRPAAVPAPARRLVEARRGRAGVAERTQRAAGGFRGHEPAHGHAPAGAAGQGARC